MTPEPPSLPHGISVLIHTRNSAETLSDTLKSVNWADELIVIDMESSDDTGAIALAHNARVIPIPAHDRVDEVRNTYLSEAAYEWTLVLDSDETLPDDASATISALLLEHGDDIDAFVIPRLNRIGDHWMRGCGWFPDPQIRLFRTGTVFWGGGHHQIPQPRAGLFERILHLENDHQLFIHHRNYADLSALIQKTLHYALSDVYPENPDTFDFRESVGAAYQAFASRHQPQADGDYATAVATVMAWDQLIRGLIEWDRLGRVHPLHESFSLPPPSVSFTKEQTIRSLQQELAETTLRLEQAEGELHTLQHTRWVRAMQWLIRRFPRLISFLSSPRR